MPYLCVSRAGAATSDVTAALAMLIEVQLHTLLERGQGAVNDHVSREEAGALQLFTRARLG